MNQPSTLIDEVRETRRLLAEGRRIRENADLTQARLAREIPADRTTLSRWESGLASPRGQQRERYLELLQALEEATR